MFGFFDSNDSLVGERIPENSRQAVYDLFARHYNVRSVTKSYWGDDRYMVELRDGKILNVRTGTGYTLLNQPYVYIRDVSRV